jgi:hypothetical protein
MFMLDKRALQRENADLHTFVVPFARSQALRL